MREHTTICKVDVGQDLNDLKNEMLYCLDYFEHRNNPVYGIFNGQLYVTYAWAKNIEDIDLF